jgi:ABC-2 type transport system ATP-binding protein
MPVIEVEGLRKEYRRLRGGRTVALDGLDLSVPEGGVFGFLGPNGAGKTTTIRCLLGLVRPSAGRARLLGAASTRELRPVLTRVGSLVEAPAFATRMTGRRNLELLGRIDGIGSSAVHTVLGRVGLAERADDPVRAYSLGMKQRLAIAAALLKDPEVLILDEPANGLDPAGIKEVRELLKDLGAEGRTVFVSSHILSEVQQMADRVAIVAQGRTIVSGPVQEVLASRRRSGLVVGVDDPVRAAAVLNDAGIASSVDDGVVLARVPSDEGARVTRALADHGLYLSELRADEADLETVFLELTAEAEP